MIDEQTSATVLGPGRARGGSVRHWHGAAGVTSDSGARPTHFPGPQLLGLARWYALQVPAWACETVAPISERRSLLLERSDAFEVWLVRWPLEVGLALHDHGGASGAFHVLRGVLEATCMPEDGGKLRRRRLGPGEGAFFDEYFVHSVVNPEMGTATSVHAYAPLPVSLTFYEERRA